MDVIGVIIALSLAFILVAVLAIGWVREVLKSKTAEMRHQLEIKEQRADAVKRSRSVIEGQVFEQLVPHFPEWNHTPSEARFLGSPIDYVVFEGMSTGTPEKVVLVEVKKGSSSTTPLQNKIKKLIKDGKVEWETLKLE
uniref:Putative holliday junction resolvase n=1 Tax=viral metagenome TaxID=1070528 RepID=A0A6M3L246_9ZZZZ